MTILEAVLETGTGDELDQLGRLLDCPRKGYSPDRQEADLEYRNRLGDHNLVKLLLTYVKEQP
jgi:hypothetical protein